MQHVIIENTNKWRVDSIGNGLMYEFTDKETGQTAFLQGDDAASWREEYDEVSDSYGTPNTRHSRLTWNECLAELCGVYVWN